MTGLTTPGVFHTAIGLIALICGFIALARGSEYDPQAGAFRQGLFTRAFGLIVSAEPPG